MKVQLFAVPVWQPRVPKKIEDNEHKKACSIVLANLRNTKPHKK